MAFSKLRSRLLGLFAFWALLLCVLGALTASRLQSMTAALSSIYVDRLLCQVQLRAIGEAYGTRIPAIVGHWREALIDAPTAITQITAARQQAAADWARYKSSDETPEEKVLIPRTEPLLARANATASDALRYLAAGDTHALDAWQRLDAPEAFDPLVAMVDELFELQAPAAAGDVQKARQDYYATLAGMGLLIVFAFVAGGAAAWWMVVHYTGVARESDRALRRMSAFYSALSRTNHLIVRAPDAATLLHEVCTICTETDHALIATVFVLEGSQAHCHAVAGPEADLFSEFPPVWEVRDAAFASSATATALASGRHHVGMPLPGHPRPRPRPAADPAQRQHIRGVAAFPLFRDERVHGALTLYSAEDDFFDAAMVRLLSELAGDLSFALDHLDREADGVLQQVQTQQALQGFQTMFQSSPVACEISTLGEARVLEINDTMAAFHGLWREQIVGTTCGQLGRLLPEADHRAYRERLDREGRVHNLAAQVRRPQGGLAAVILNAEIIDYQGQPCVMTMVLDTTGLGTASGARAATTSRS